MKDWIGRKIVDEKMNREGIITEVCRDPGGIYWFRLLCDQDLTYWLRAEEFKFADNQPTKAQRDAIKSLLESRLQTPPTDPTTSPQVNPNTRGASLD